MRLFFVSIITAIVLGFAFMGFVQKPDLFLDIQHPSKVQSGNSFDLTLQISKKDITNFSRLQIKLPKGFSASIKNPKGGSFSFVDQVIKVIWVQLPFEDEFEVVFKIYTDKKLDDEFKFEGDISFIVGNERKKKKVVTKTISISPNYEGEGDVVYNKMPRDESSEFNLPKITCERSVTKSNIALGESIEVVLKIDKGNVSGVGKIVESVPEGFKVEVIKKNGAIFNVTENQIKFLWMNLPAEPKFEVKYKLMATNTANIGATVVEGMFSYVFDDETQQLFISSNQLMVKSDATDEIEENVENQDEIMAIEEDAKEVNLNSDDPSETEESIQLIEQSLSEKKPEETVLQADEKEEEQEVASEQLTKQETEQERAQGNEQEQEMVNTPNTASQIQKEDDDNKVKTQTEVNYRVQICATRKPSSSDYFVQNHNINDKIFVNMHEGWHKFTVGGFNIYNQARERREVVRLNHKIGGAFVTAYNQGQRITVQEALMITKEEWTP